MENAGMEKVAVLGGGLIGSSWAANFLWKGRRVSVYDISPEAVATAKDRIRSNLEYLVSKEILSAAEMKAAVERAEFTTSIEDAVKEVRFIQESVLENYGVKQALLAEVDKYARPDAVFASSTSGLLITKTRSCPKDALARIPIIHPISSRWSRSAKVERRAKTP